METNISELIGKTLSKIDVDHKEAVIVFTTNDGLLYKLFHDQDCCESVIIDDIEGDISDLIDTPILMAEEINNEQFEADFKSKFTELTDYGYRTDKDGNYEPESCTWTFYKFSTIKGYVTIRWFGESNGYYSESVSFVKANANGEFSRW